MYSQLLSSQNPGLIVILLDQSASMSDIYEGTTSKSVFAAYAVNKVIGQIIYICTNGAEVRDRCVICVLTYCEEDAKVVLVKKVSDLSKMVVNVVERRERYIDSSGVQQETIEKIREFVTPKASGGTPMEKAFLKASEIVEEFIKGHPNSFPPILINVTDGYPNIPDMAREKALKLLSLKTTDGNLLMMNVHIPEKDSTYLGRIELPNSDKDFETITSAKFLFGISSILPDQMAAKATQEDLHCKPGSKAFIFNADPKSLVRMLNFGSLVAFNR